MSLRASVSVSALKYVVKLILRSVRKGLLDQINRVKKKGSEKGRFNLHLLDGSYSDFLVRGAVTSFYSCFRDFQSDLDEPKPGVQSRAHGNYIFSFDFQ
jgi:hypothetical protein